VCSHFHLLKRLVFLKCQALVLCSVSLSCCNWINEVRMLRAWKPLLGNAFPWGRLLDNSSLTVWLCCCPLGSEPPVPVGAPCPSIQHSPFGLGSVEVSWGHFYSWMKVISTWDGP
jgi:hypothetical protein